MKIIYNKILPFGNYLAINICGILFVKASKDYKLSERTLNHERIHTKQIKEMGYIFFYLWYLIEWLYQAVASLFTKKIKPYYHISFEQEAYDNDCNLNYLETRKWMAWTKYLGKFKKY